MSLGIKEAMNIAIECILFGFIVLIIAFFSTYDKGALIIKDNENIQMREIEEYRNLYEFTMGSEMNLEDINSSISLIGTTSLKSYSVTNIQKFLSINTNKNVYKRTIVRGEDIIRFASLYPKDYNIIVLKKNNSNNNLAEVYKLLTTDKDENWLISSVTEKIGNNNIKDFYCMAVYDTNNYWYDSVLFCDTDIISQWGY